MRSTDGLTYRTTVQSAGRGDRQEHREHDRREREEGERRGGAVPPRARAQVEERSEHERDEEQGGQEPPGDRPSGAVRDEERRHSLVRLGGQQGEAGGEEEERRVERHRQLHPEGDEPGRAVEVADDHQQGHQPGGEHQPVGGPPAPAAAKVAGQQRETEEDEVQRGVRGHPVRDGGAEHLLAEEPIVDPRVPPGDRAHENEGAADGDHGAAEGAPAARQAVPAGPAVEQQD
jgi:hypothetical protein